ncbi:hypothetical protein PY092_12860 [Muricauda sp. 334s03]|uniref:Uncharacterized protein n=1 Tax=Flagellimonas yonaguniensis TaxID=3031325 RepID=A0ABT5Y0S1_9FLAO|nr:hypothetical protein [[Muricauda] yonaguniensis]MDF0717046.1 hypothetical protein [[Muricauda] yonaguniensis]
MRKPFLLFTFLVILITISKVLEKHGPTTVLEYSGVISVGLPVKNGADPNLSNKVTEADPYLLAKNEPNGNDECASFHSSIFVNFALDQDL